MTNNNQLECWITGCGWVTPFAHGSLDDVLDAINHKNQLPTRSDKSDSSDTIYQQIPDDWKDQVPDITKELRADRGGWMAALALTDALKDAQLDLSKVDPTRVGAVVGHGLAGQMGMIQFAQDVRAQTPRFVSPLHFPQTVGNYLAGALARGYKLQGPNLTLANGCASGLDAILEASSLINTQQADVIIAGGVEPLSEPLAKGLSQAHPHPSEGVCLFVIESPQSCQARGGKPLAILHTHDKQPLAAAFTSSAGSMENGSIYMEHWIGNCFGASGAAALAAAIGAAKGHAIPIIEKSDQVAIRSIKLENGTPEPGKITAVIKAVGEGNSISACTITIPINA